MLPLLYYHAKISTQSGSICNLLGTMHWCPLQRSVKDCPCPSCPWKFLPLSWSLMMCLPPTLYYFFFQFCLFIYVTILYWFCHTLTWIRHGCTCVPHPETPSQLLPHPIPLGHPSALVPSTLYHALNLDWRFISHVIIYMFQCHSPISSYPHPLPQSAKDCCIHLCLFCCLTYRVIITIFPNSIYMH